MSLIELKCKNCGAILKTDRDTEQITCEYCHTNFKVDKENKNSNNFKDFLRGFCGIFIYLFLNIALGSILTLLGINVSELSKKQAAIISMGVSFIILAILIALSWKTLKKNIKDYKENWSELFKRNFKYWICSTVIMITCNLIISLTFNRLTSANDQTIRNIFDIFPIYIIIEAAILAPITEELVFRQSIRYIFKNKFLFITLSGLIFGFMHVASLNSWVDFLYIIPYSVPGFFFAYMLYKEDNVLVPISFHMIHNSMALILLIISKLTGAM